ncbi:type VI secretion system-associated protein TagO [Ruegeria sp. HKCCE3926]|uniref:type VI secretion system-associated protein TagO n=1 Tax=Ruegeria sp. HKCCE3926 TaxID=2794831 RepID=UPI001AE78453|nr:type VI secretion system-associated protein TagO [Ruegeria sp. HKCCE3926]
MRKHFFLALTSSVVICGAAAFGQENAGACTAIDEDLARLACYDQALGRSPTGDPTPSSNWKVRSTKSDFTDQTDVYVSTLAENPLQCSYRNTPTLFVRCLEGQTNVFVSHGCYAPPDRKTEQIDVQIRIDGEDTYTRQLYTSTDDKAFGWWDVSSSRSAIHTLLDHDSIVFRFLPYRDPPQIVRFDISDLRDVLQSTESSCSWGL